MNTQALVDFKAQYDARTEARNKIAQEMFEGMEKDAFLLTAGRGLLGGGAKLLGAVGNWIRPASQVGSKVVSATPRYTPGAGMSSVVGTAGRSAAPAAAPVATNAAGFANRFRSTVGNSLQRGASALRQGATRFENAAGGAGLASQTTAARNIARTMGSTGSQARSFVNSTRNNYLRQLGPTQQYKNLYAAAPVSTAVGTGVAGAGALGMGAAAFGGGGGSDPYAGQTYMPGSRGGNTPVYPSSFRAGGSNFAGGGGAPAMGAMPMRLGSSGPDLNAIRNYSPVGAIAALGARGAATMFDPMNWGGRDPQVTKALRARVMGDRFGDSEQQLMYNMMYPEDLAQQTANVNQAKNQLYRDGLNQVRAYQPSPYGF